MGVEPNKRGSVSEILKVSYKTSVYTLINEEHQHSVTTRSPVVYSEFTMKIGQSFLLGL